LRWVRSASGAPTLHVLIVTSLLLSILRTPVSLDQPAPAQAARVA
jgi:hypothetical protein